MVNALLDPEPTYRGSLLYQWIPNIEELRNDVVAAASGPALNDEEILKDLNVEIAVAESNGDRVWFDEIAAQELVVFRANGTFDDRSAFLNKVGVCGSRETNVDSIKILGDRAIVECIVTLGESSFYSLRFFVRINGKWRLIAIATDGQEPQPSRTGSSNTAEGSEPALPPRTSGGAEAAPPTDAEILSDLNLEIDKAERDGDRVWLDENAIAPKLAVFRADRSFDDRDAYLNKVAVSELRKTDVRSIEILGNRAVVECIVTLWGGSFHSLRLFVRTAGEWRLIAAANDRQE